MAIKDVVDGLNKKMGTPEQVLPEVQRIATDNNSNATPEKNAMDIDTLAVAILILTKQVQEIMSIVMQNAPVPEVEETEAEE